MYRMNYKLALLGNHFFDIIKDYSICDGSFYSLVKIFDIDEISEGKEKKNLLLHLAQTKAKNLFIAPLNE